MKHARDSWIWIAALVLSTVAFAYPPAVGIVGNNRDCLSCHASNGPWKDDAGTIVDIVDAATGKSIRQPDGRFLLEVARGRTRTVITQIGRKASDEAPPPLRTAWLYLDPTQLETGSLSKFAPGWNVNLPMACRIVGDDVPGYPGAAMTALPMTVRPGDSARNSDLELQLMLTSGESAKGNPNAWLMGNYLVKEVMLGVVDP
jgi:hypothetical protein